MGSFRISSGSKMSHSFRKTTEVLQVLTADSHDMHLELDSCANFQAIHVYRQVRLFDRSLWCTPYCFLDTEQNHMNRSATTILQGNRVVFNVAGNQYRLVVKINYPYRVAYIRFIGTHAEYDAIDVTSI